MYPSLVQPSPVYSPECSVPVIYIIMYPSLVQPSPVYSPECSVPVIYVIMYPSLVQPSPVYAPECSVPVIYIIMYPSLVQPSPSFSPGCLYWTDYSYSPCWLIMVYQLSGGNLSGIYYLYQLSTLSRFSIILLND